MDGSPASWYDAFADRYESHAEGSAWNAHYDRPAMIELLGDVTDKRVLDVGCGPGIYAAELVRRGARVTGFDESAEMVRLARNRLGAQADIRQGTLGQPLTWLADESQDLALMALVLHHLDNRVSALRELARVLRPHGRLVLSTSHPTTDWLGHGGSYFTREVIEETWRDDWQVRYWRQPLESWCAEFAEAGFAIERLVEPRPVPGMADRYPEDHERLLREPGFIGFRLLKTSTFQLASVDVPA
jgi:SAM-dependent methyltransferase